MKRILFLFAAVLIAVATSAKGDDSVAGVKFGTQKNDAVTQFESAFGAKGVAQADQITFSKVNYMGFKFTTAKFYFNENGKFNQARFYMQVPNKATAVKEMNAIEKAMAKEYNSISEDEDEDGKFVKGGLGPDGQSLFTIYTVRIQGKWNVGLRYGAFNI